MFIKSVISVVLGVFVIVGTVIGAGFASGREILVFFQFDVKNILVLGFVLFVSLYFLSIYFMQLGRTSKINCINDMLNIKNVAVKRAVASILAMTFLVSTSSMMAGIDELAKMSLGLVFPFASILSFVIATFFIVKGVAGLKMANSILVPVIISFIVAISIFTLQNNAFKLPQSGNGFLRTGVDAVGYALMNILLASVVLCKLGEQMSAKESKVTAILSCAVIAFVVVLFLIAMSSSENLTDVPMPIVFLANEISKNFATVSSTVIYFGIFTTLIASYYCLYEYVFSFVHSRTLSVILCFVAGLLLSRLGFSQIVAIFYPIESVLAVVLIVTSCRKPSSPQIKPKHTH